MRKLYQQKDLEHLETFRCVYVNFCSIGITTLGILPAMVSENSRPKWTIFKIQMNLDLEWFGWNQYIHLKEQAPNFDTKTFKCVYVNFCSIGIIIQPILCVNYTSTKVERIYANCNVILVTRCNVFVLLQDRWLWCHSSKWYMKHKSLILMSSKVYCMHQKGIDI